MELLTDWTCWVEASWIEVGWAGWTKVVWTGWTKTGWADWTEVGWAGWTDSDQAKARFTSLFERLVISYRSVGVAAEAVKVDLFEKVVIYNIIC